jgi:hypothetical protein
VAQELRGHAVRTVPQQGWAGLGNGELLTQSSLRIVVLVASSNALEDLLPLVPRILQTIPEARPGQVQRVGGED